MVDQRKRDAASLANRVLHRSQTRPSMDESRRDALLKEYSEVASNFRLLTDIRFKLLAFLPIAAAVAAAFRSDSATVPGLALSLFGLVVTLGLVTYNRRNDQLYYDLVRRAATIERSLGLPDGGFANRPRAWLVVNLLGKEWHFDHGTGVGTIYVTSIAFWLFGVFASVLELVRRAYVALGFPKLSLPDLFAGPSTWVNLMAGGLAVFLTWWGAKSIKDQDDKRRKSMRNSAKKAVEEAISKGPIPFRLSDLRNDKHFLGLCKDLYGGKRDKIQARLDFYASLDQNSLGHYLPRVSNEKLSASHLVALLTDLPPQWIFDCATNRQGALPISRLRRIRQSRTSRLLKDLPVTERRLELAGVSTSLLEGGEGPPLVLLHGQGNFAVAWMTVIPDLVRTHHVIAPDLPGLGASEVPEGPPGANAVLVWLSELIDHTCATPPAVVGISLGGQFATRFAAHRSEQIVRLVIVDTPGLVGGVRPAPGALLALVGHSARPSERSALRLLRYAAFDPERVRQQMGERWEPFVEYMVDRARTPSVRKANRRLMREVGLRQIPPEDLARISVPTTLIWGKHDRVAPLRSAEEASARYGWPLQVIEDAGHVSPVEQPETFLEALHAALGPP